MTLMKIDVQLLKKLQNIQISLNENRIIASLITIIELK